MPLSEHEQHLLDQIETGLSADSPGLASQLRTTPRARRRSVPAGQRRRGAGRILLGLLLLLTGLLAANGAGIALALAGYLLIVVSAPAIWTTRQQRRSPS